jgi:hypothetical protein
MEGRKDEGRKERKEGREGGIIYNFYLKFLLHCQQQENQECYVILWSVSSSMPFRYLKQQRTDLGNICIQVVQ